MSIPYSAGTAFTTATCTSAWIEYPFIERGDNATKVYHHSMMVDRLSYAPLAFNDTMTAADEKPERSPFADDANAFWVKDTEPRDIGGGKVEFDRIFAKIPVTSTEGNGIYAFTYPGIDSAVTSTLGTSTSNESVTFDSGTGEAIFVFDVAPADTSKFILGQNLTINNDNETNGFFEGKSPGSGSWFKFTANSSFVTDITSNTITARKDISPFIDVRSPVAITTFTAFNTLPARDSFTRNANSRTIFTYVKSDDITTLSIASKFEPVTSAGVPTDTLTTTTVPTKADYLSSVQDSDYLNAESTKIRRWMGNIWEKEAILIQAL